MSSWAGDEFNQMMGKEIRNNLFTNSRLNIKDSTLLDHMDPDVLNRARAEVYRQMYRRESRLYNHTEDENDMQKLRDTQHDAGQIDARSFSLSDHVEKIYFDYYGEGFNGGPAMDPPGTQYRCPCGKMKFMMPAACLPPECPACRRLTPIGKLQRDGVIKR